MLKHLAEGFPDAVAKLTMQYRMNEDICHLSNLIGEPRTFTALNTFRQPSSHSFTANLFSTITFSPSLQGVIEMW